MNKSAFVTSVPPADIPHGNFPNGINLPRPMISVDIKTQVHRLELSMAANTSKDGLSPDHICREPTQPCSTKGSSQPCTILLAERRRDSIQLYPNAVKNISETCDKADITTVSIEPHVDRLASTDNTNPDENIDDSGSGAALSSSMSTLSSSLSSIFSAPLAESSTGTYSNIAFGDSRLLSPKFRGRYYLRFVV